MYAIGKINSTGSSRQLHNLAPWSKDINFVREQIDLQALDKLQRIASAFLQLQQILSPLSRPLLITVEIAVALIQPMPGDAVIGNSVHLFGANLYLDGYAMHAE